MGVYWYLACRKCKTMLGIHKLTEPTPEKDRAIWNFLRMHSSPYGQNHDLRVVGDDCPDNDIITDTEQGWVTQYNVTYPSK